MVVINTILNVLNSFRVHQRENLKNPPSFLIFKALHLNFQENMQLYWIKKTLRRCISVQNWCRIVHGCDTRSDTLYETRDTADN